MNEKGQATLIISIIIALVIGVAASWFARPTQGGKVSELESEVSNLQGQVSDLESQVSLLQSDKSGLSEQVSNLQTQVSSLTELQTFEVPEGVVPITPVIPGMGAHWTNPADMPFGPIFLTTDNKPTSPGKLLGVEYMFSKDMMKEVTVTEAGEEITFKSTRLFTTLENLGIEKVIDHVDVSFISHGHEGFPKPHFDVHAYIVSQEKVNRLTAPGS